MTKEYFFVWVKLFPICFFLILISIFYLGELDSSNNKKENTEKLSGSLTINELEIRLGHEYAIYLMDCKYKGVDWKNKCDQSILDNYIDQFEGKYKKKSYGIIIIYFIYFLLSLSLSFQVTLLIVDKSVKNNNNLNYAYISDWSINSAPILGVLGTVVSFSLLVGSSSNGDIQEVFRDSFFSAAITTILGGFIYILNLFLNVFIQNDNSGNA